MRFTTEEPQVFDDCSPAAPRATRPEGIAFSVSTVYNVRCPTASAGGSLCVELRLSSYFSSSADRVAEKDLTGTARIERESQGTIVELLVIGVFFLLLYLPFPSIDYDANGVIEAMKLESGAQFSPNHILYGAIGRALYRTAQALGYEGKSIHVLQVFNAFCGAAGVALAFAAFVRLGASKRGALAAAGLWGTSFIYWYYSTDVSYLTLSAVFTAAALWRSASMIETGSERKTFLLGLLVSLAILTFQMLVFLVPITLWPLRRRAREAIVFILTILFLTGGVYLALGASYGYTNAIDLLSWAGGYAGGQLPEWGRFEVSRVNIAASAAVRSFQWDVFAWGREIIQNPFRPFVWRLGAGAVCFVVLALLTLALMFLQRHSKLFWMIGAYFAFWPFIVWFDPVASFWFLIPNLFLCAAASFAWSPWVSRPAGFLLVFGGVAVMAGATFVSWVWNKHIDPGVPGRKAECIAQRLEPNDAVIATDWTWPAALEYFYGIQPIPVIDLATALQDRDKLFDYISNKVRETRERQGRVFIIEPDSYTPEHLEWLAAQTQFSVEDFQRFPGRIAFQCEDAKFREVVDVK
jgi:hypothetical protein